MNLDRYTYSADSTYLDYEFESIGPKGTIKKLVRLSKIDIGIYNLGFGDLVDEETDSINDDVITNNGDAEKVLSTIALIAHDFTLKYPGALLFVEGTNATKTRLYQMNISKYWDEIKKTFEIFGIRNNEWEPFRKGVNYSAFIARRR